MCAMYLSQMRGSEDITFRERNGDNGKSYYLAHKNSPKNNLTLNLGDIDEDLFVTLVTAPSYYKGDTRSVPSALVAVPNEYTEDLDRLRQIVRDGIIEKQALGPMSTPEVLKMTPNSMLENVLYPPKEGKDDRVMSVKFPDDCNYFRRKPGMQTIVPITRDELQVGDQLVITIRTAALHKMPTAGCSRYAQQAVVWHPRSSSSTPNAMPVLGSKGTSVSVDKEEENFTTGEAEVNKQDEMDGAEAFGYGPDEDEPAAKRARTTE